ncbi:MAG: phage holin family protein [Chloroflexi bacterium]|nr:MAG: phage holin family protein [Chloroflexota bacterium]
MRHELRAPVQSTVDGNGSATSRGLIASVVGDAQRLVALEVALAKQELKELAVANAIAAGLLVFGALLALLGVLVAVPSMVVWLVPWHWQAAAVWAGAYVLLAVLLIMVGRARLRFQVPPRTLESLKENKEWALRRVRSKSK